MKIKCGQQKSFYKRQIAIRKIPFHHHKSLGIFPRISDTPAQHLEEIMTKTIDIFIQNYKLKIDTLYKHMIVFSIFPRKTINLSKELNKFDKTVKYLRWKALQQKLITFDH